MSGPSRRSHRYLRLLRTGRLRRVRQADEPESSRLLRRMCGGTCPRRSSVRSVVGEESAKRPGERPLLLSLWRTLRRRRRWRLVLSARAVSGLVYRGMQPRVHCVRHVVWPDRAKAEDLAVVSVPGGGPSLGTDGSPVPPGLRDSQAIDAAAAGTSSRGADEWTICLVKPPPICA